MQLVPLTGIGRIERGAPLGDVLGDALAAASDGAGASPASDDAIVVCQKVVSRAEGRTVLLRDVEPSDFARRFGERWEKDPRLIELVFRESRRIVRMDQGHLIVETRHGFVCANAGIDQSNAFDAESAILLPDDPDRSARELRESLRARWSPAPGVVVSDTFGRPWRHGQIDVAIGVSGMAAVVDLRGRTDWVGRRLEHSMHAAADAVAAAAGLLMAKDGGVPAVWVRGIPGSRGEGAGRDLVREPETDLFR